VLFRDSAAPSFTLSLPSAQLSKIYGQTDPNIASVRSAVLNAYTGHGADTLTVDVAAAGGGSNTFGVAASEVIAALTGTRAAGANVNGGTPYVYSLSAHPSFNTTVTGTAPTLVIGKASLTSVIGSKTYDGRSDLTLGTSDGMLSLSGVNGETATIATGSATLTGKDFATNGQAVSSITAVGLTTASGATLDLNNYDLTNIPAAGSYNKVDINKATLTVNANADARFVTQSDTSGYKGVYYAGFVAGEDSSVLNGTLSVSRTDSATNVLSGSYAGTLVPTGLTSNNYDIQYVNGNYTILPAAKLLVTTTNQTVTYGTTPTYTTTAEYLDNNNQVISMLSVAGANNNQYTFTDGVGGTVTLALKPYTGTAVAAQSTSGNTVVGNYAIQDLGFTQTGSNFNGIPVFLGTLTVAQKGITPSLSGISKVYDGSTAMDSISVQMAGMLANDALGISGIGAFNQKNVGTNLGYTATSISLGGNDASNYYLVGANTTYSGTDGVITAKALTLAGTTVANKTYDGNTNATITAQGTLTGLVGAETLTLNNLTGTFDTAAVGTHKAVALSASLDNGLNGGLASNYTLDASTAYADITAANNNGGNGGSKPIIHPPKPIIPTDNNSGGGGGDSSGNPYLIVPDSRNNSADSCTPNTLEDCLCETQEPRPVEGIAICYQPKKTASNTPAKGRRG
jgi:hypothetical protein